MSWPQWLTMLVVAVAATFFFAERVDPGLVVHGVLWLVVGFALLPIGFTIGLAAVALTITVLLGLIALPAYLTGRPTGQRDVVTAAWQLPGHVLPGFWRALRRVRKPRLWGAVVGTQIGVLLFLSLRGLTPA